MEKEVIRTYAEEKRFNMFVDKEREKVKTPEDFNKFKTELKSWINRKVPIPYNIGPTWLGYADRVGIHGEESAKELIEFIQSAECTLTAKEKKEAVEYTEGLAAMYEFNRFFKKALDSEYTPETFAAFKTGLKAWINRGYDPSSIAHHGLFIAEKNEVPAEDFIKEITEYVRSPECTLSATTKRLTVVTMEKKLRIAVGSDLKLFGKTIDDKDFDWQSLRGKYVLVKFTSTWCGPCAAEIPGMLEAYKEYHDKGLEIVSVYIWEHGGPVERVKKHVETEKLPWIIISETLTARAAEEAAKNSLMGGVLGAIGRKVEPETLGDYYGIPGVPTMLLVDKEGKIIMMDARGEKLKTKLTYIFE
jgi:thiol-disulfide isomerase/thioredoxin